VDDYAEMITANDPQLTDLNLRGSNVAARGIQMLVQSLRDNTKVQKIDLHGNALSDGGAKVFMDGIAHSVSITSLNLGYNGLFSLQGLGPRSLIRLSLEGNSLGDEGTRLLTRAIMGKSGQHTLTELDLSSTSMGVAGAEIISELLEQGSLHSIDLSANRLLDEGAGAIAEAVNTDSCALTQLSLSGNYITDLGTDVIQRALLNNTKLTTLDLEMNLITATGATMMADLLLEGVSAVRTVLLAHNQGVTCDQLETFKLESAILPSLRSACDTPQVQVVSLDLSGRGLGDRCAEHIARVLVSNTTLESLDLSNNKLGNGAAFSFSQMLQNNQTLTELELRNNKITNDGADSLLQVCLSKPLLRLNLCGNDVQEDVLCVISLQAELYHLSGNSPSMQSLDMSNINAGDGAMRALATELFSNTHLQQLLCGGNPAITSRGIVSLSQALEVNETLTHLDLTADGIGTAGAACIGKLLPTNRGLRTLVLRDNGVGDEGVVAIAEGVKQNGQLTELDLALNELTDVAVEAIMAALWKWDEEEEEKKAAEEASGKKKKNAEGREVYVEPFNRTLQVLDLGGNQLKEAGGMQVSNSSCDAFKNLVLPINVLARRCNTRSLKP
jgi:Ran GTPase-activating protein (RanGAP) involved in mRNA processing and transport